MPSTWVSRTSHPDVLFAIDFYQGVEGESDHIAGQTRDFKLLAGDQGFGS